jgi:hypothetical protein
MAVLTTAFVFVILTNSHAQDVAFEITADLAGKSYTPGDTMWITWNTNNDEVTQAVIELSPNGGKRWYQISEGEAINSYAIEWERYPWVVADTIYDEFTGEAFSVASDSCSLTIYDYQLVYDPVRSEGLFAIAPASSIRLTANRLRRDSPALARPANTFFAHGQVEAAGWTGLYDMKGRAVVGTRNALLVGRSILVETQK